MNFVRDPSPGNHFISLKNFMVFLERYFCKLIFTIMWLKEIMISYVRKHFHQMHFEFAAEKNLLPICHTVGSQQTSFGAR